CCQQIGRDDDAERQRPGILVHPAPLHHPQRNHRQRDAGDAHDEAGTEIVPSLCQLTPSESHRGAGADDENQAGTGDQLLSPAAPAIFGRRITHAATTPPSPSRCWIVGSTIGTSGESITLSSTLPTELHA